MVLQHEVLPLAGITHDPRRVGHHQPVERRRGARGLDRREGRIQEVAVLVRIGALRIERDVVSPALRGPVIGVDAGPRSHYAVASHHAAPQVDRAAARVVVVEIGVVQVDGAEGVQELMGHRQHSHVLGHHDGGAECNRHERSAAGAELVRDAAAVRPDDRHSVVGTGVDPVVIQ